MIRILVVDDDARLNQSVCTYLNDSGYEAKGCLSADSAYDAIGARQSGVDFIGVEYGFGFKNLQEIEAYHPVFIAYFVDDLIQFFDHC